MPAKSKNQDAETENTAQMQEPEPPSGEKPIYVYAGPTLPNGLLKRYATLRGSLEEIKEYYKSLFEPYPELDCSKIERLMIPLPKFPKIKHEAEEPGTLYHNYCNDVTNMIVMAMEARKKQAEKLREGGSE